MPKDPPVGGFSLQLGQGNAQNARRKVKITEEEENRNQELVTSFAESGLVSAAIPASSHLSGSSQPRVIPNQGNDIRGLGGRKSKKARYAFNGCPVIPSGIHFRLEAGGALVFPAINLIEQPLKPNPIPN